MLSPKENLLKDLRGDIPEYVPNYTMGSSRNGPPSSCLIEPALVSRHKNLESKVDIWGVEYVPTESTNGMLIPKTHDFILDDIRKWRDVIKAPSLEGVDWEKMVAADIKRHNLDQSKTAFELGSHFGYFQLLMSFMGFTNGLCAMYEEPDEVKALLEFLCDFYCDVMEHYAAHCDPDIWNLADDTAAWAAPFISPEMYREFLIPLYDRQAKIGRDRGLPISMHNCGKSECFFDDLVKIGVSAWNPAQTCNDLDSIKEKNGNRLVICGGWDGRGRLLEDDVTYEEIYDSVKNTLDRLTPGGGYVFMGFFLSAAGDMKTMKKNEMLYKAFDALKNKYY